MKKMIFGWILITICLIAGCEEEPYEFTEIECQGLDINSNTSIELIKEMYSFGGPVLIEEDLIIEGYVVSNDRGGNFYKSLSIQDKPENPTSAISISIDRNNLYSKYELGRKVYVKLKGLAIGNSFGRVQIGQIGNGELKGISNFEYDNHILSSCEVAELVPLNVSIGDVRKEYLDMFVAFEEVQFHENELGNALGEPNSNQSIDRIIEGYNSNCIKEGKINLRTSGFADFKNIAIPEGKGIVQGVLQNYYSDYQLVLRDESDLNFEIERCEESLWESNFTLSELRGLFQGDLVELNSYGELIVEGYVNSTDQNGNFKNRIVIQDAIEESSAGIQVLIDKDHIFEDYEIGELIQVKLKNLYLGEYDGNLSIGIHDRGKVGFIKEDLISDFILGTDEISELIPEVIEFEELSDKRNSSTLIRIENVQLDSLDLGKAFTYYSGDDEGVRTIVKCDSYKKMQIRTEGDASFANNMFPIKNGSITGVFGEYLELRSELDVNFENPYEVCETLIPSILITEVADPSNSVGARFVEVQNRGERSFTLDNWKLEKYINGSSNPSSGAVDLTGVTMEPGSYIVISNTDFESVFGFPSTISSSYISGNGDDVYRLVDSGGKTIDIFGVIGKDGNGENWEYLDGRAVRKSEVKIPSKNFNFEQWIISSKINNSSVNYPNTPKYAPKDYSPFSE